MRSAGFQRFVAGFAGTMLVLGVIVAALTGDESMIGTVAFAGALYAVYMVQFVRKEKERGEKKKEKADSPLLRRRL